MKFVIAAVVVLAVAMGVQSSIVAGVPGLGLGISNLGLVNGVGLGVNGLGLGLGVNTLGLGVAGLGQTLVQGPAWVGAPAAVNIAGAGIISPSQIPAAVNIASSPAAIAVAPQVAVAQQVAVAPQAAIVSPLAGHGATYVAKNRGAIHTAPLAGHIKSAASINVAPAPGTW